LDVQINGVPQSAIDVHDRALQYGDGLFETLRVVHGEPIALDEHLERLGKGAQLLGFAAQSLNPIRSELSQFCHPKNTGAVKLILSRGVSPRGYRIPVDCHSTRILYWSEPQILSEKEYAVGVQVCRCKIPLPGNAGLGGIKTLNRLHQVLARSEWQDDSLYEGLMSNEQQHIIEGTQSNLFLLREGEVMTPEIGKFGIAGVMRARVLRQLKAWKIPCRIGLCREDDVLNASQLFLTNSLIGVVPVARYLNCTYAPHVLIKRLQHYFHPPMALPCPA
jgi:4-amino-4-deoxychorismate lyase